MADVPKIRKLYRLSGGGGGGASDSKGKRRRKDGSEEGSGGGGGDDGKAGNVDRGVGREREELEVSILGLMALRGAV